MKVLKISLLVFFLSAAFIACEKDDDSTPPPFSIIGTWEGTTGNGGYFGAKFQQGGQMQRILSSGSVSATGSYQLNGNTLTGNYTYITSGTQVTFTATVDKNLNTLNGTWQNNGGEQGTMTAQKKN